MFSRGRRDRLATSMPAQSREEFCDDYRRMHSMALESGARVHPIRVNSPNAPFVDERHQADFLKACHRGYEKAQRTVVESISSLRSDSTIEDAEREFRELALRRIIDGIAVLLLQNKAHLIRRFVLHDDPPNVEVRTIHEALREADRLDSESRLTFALIADLTTFIHVCDILRIDFRNRRLSLIELKSGRVNDMLLSERTLHARRGIAASDRKQSANRSEASKPSKADVTSADQARPR